MKKLADRVEALAARMELPPEALPGDLKLSLTGAKRAFLENHRGIISFDSSCVSVAAKKGSVLIRGDGLYLAAMSQDCLLICGKIQAVEWE